MVQQYGDEGSLGYLYTKAMVGNPDFAGIFNTKIPFNWTTELHDIREESSDISHHIEIIYLF